MLIEMFISVWPKWRPMISEENCLLIQILTSCGKVGNGGGMLSLVGKPEYRSYRLLKHLTLMNPNQRSMLSIYNWWQFWIEIDNYQDHITSDKLLKNVSKEKNSKLYKNNTALPSIFYDACAVQCDEVITFIPEQLCSFFIPSSICA